MAIGRGTTPTVFAALLAFTHVFMWDSVSDRMPDVPLAPLAFRASAGWGSHLETGGWRRVAQFCLPAIAAIVTYGRGYSLELRLGTHVAFARAALACMVCALAAVNALQFGRKARPRGANVPAFSTWADRRYRASFSSAEYD
jgi:hypothetical protein